MNKKNLALAVLFNRKELALAVRAKNNEAIDEIQAKLMNLYVALADLELEKMNVKEVA